MSKRRRGQHDRRVSVISELHITEHTVSATVEYHTIEFAPITVKRARFVHKSHPEQIERKAQRSRHLKRGVRLAQ